MAGEPITREEMIAMFGETMPMEAVQLAWNADSTKTIGEIRDELRAIAARRKAERVDIVERLRPRAATFVELNDAFNTMREAAAEIERLRAALMDIRAKARAELCDPTPLRDVCFGIIDKVATSAIDDGQ